MKKYIFLSSLLTSAFSVGLIISCSPYTNKNSLPLFQKSYFKELLNNLNSKNSTNYVDINNKIITFSKEDTVSSFVRAGWQNIAEKSVKKNSIIQFNKFITNYINNRIKKIGIKLPSYLKKATINIKNEKIVIKLPNSESKSSKDFIKEAQKLLEL